MNEGRYNIEVTLGEPAKSESRPGWGALSESQRQAMVLLLGDTFDALMYAPDKWLPAELVLRENAVFSVTLTWHLGRIDEKVAELRVEAENKERHQIETLTRIAGLNDG